MTKDFGEYCLVTGATGVIGRPAVRQLLESGRKVLAIGQKASPFPAHGNLIYVQLDLHDTEAVRGFFDRHAPQYLIHLAWEATPGKFWQSEENYRWVSSSAHLLERFVSAGGKKAVLAGSCAEYEWTNNPLDEETSPISPKTVYSSCKNAFREMAENIASGIDLVWARIFFPYGSGEDPSKLTSYIVQEISQNRLPKIQNPGRAIDLIHLDDVAKVIETLVFKDITGSVNVCSGTAALPHRIALEFASLAGKQEIAASLAASLNTVREDSAVVGSTIRLGNIFDLGSLKSLKDGLRSYET